MNRDRERAYVREQAACVAELAASEGNERIRRRWRDVNALRRPDRAPVWCRPVGCWAELLPEDALRCADPWLRTVEGHFRRVLIKHDIGDDSPVDPWFPVPALFDCDPPNRWGVEVHRHVAADPGGSWLYDPGLKTDGDFERLRFPRFSYNPIETQVALDRASDLLGDILPVKLVRQSPLTAGLQTYAADLRGLSQMMWDMIDAPHLMHRLMAYLRDSVLGAMSQVEETGLLTPNNTGPMTCSDPVGPASADGRCTFKNLWEMANSQEFDPVSPAMWQEFLLDYQMPILERYGLVGYGCCENLTQKMEGVLSIPNLRIFVCSAWTNLDRVVERVGTDYVIMWRQKASDVVFADDVDVIKRDLDEGMRRIQGCRVQIVLRELQTLAGHPDRLHVWSRLAKESAHRYA